MLCGFDHPRAKGLEFPVVVLADLSRGLLIPEKGLFACEPQMFALGSRLAANRISSTRPSTGGGRRQTKKSRSVCSMSR